MMKDVYPLRRQLSITVEASAKLREEMRSPQLSWLARTRRQLHYVILLFRTRYILERIRTVTAG